jgi:voltage-dependent potassium channel beta subunit
MEYRRLGKSGLKVSVLSFGSWLTFGKQIQDGTASALMHKAYEGGVNFFDNAEIYSKGRSEVVMGEILKKSGWSRDSYTVSSKVYWGGEKPTQTGLSRKHVTEACHAALRRLQVDYLDLYFCHRPDKSTPVEETVWAMHNLILQGKVLYWGTSEWSAQEIQEAYGIARQYHLIPPTMEQPQYNLLHRDRVEQEYARLYADIGLGATVWSPLASGLLTGKYNDGIPPGSRGTVKGYEWLAERLTDQGRLAVVRRLAPIARDLDCTLAQFALAWCLKNPHVSSVIMGASRVGQVRENLQALDVLPRIDGAVMARVEAALAG